MPDEPWLCSEYHSPAGRIMLCSHAGALTGLWFSGQKHFQSGVPGTPVRDDLCPVLLAAKRWLDRYFAGKRPDPNELPLAPSGTPFRRMIWQLLQEIPYGTTTTYGRIAERAAVILGCGSMSSQAVGNAVGHNPISVIIPCHRVIGADGHLTGYAAGISIKQYLLRLESSRLPLK